MDGFDWIMIGEADGRRAVGMKQVLEGGGILNPIRIVSNFEEFGSYLRGEDFYANRAKFPLPKLVLCDLAFGVDQVCQLLADLEEQPPTVIVTISSANEFLLDQAYEAGAKTYLRKPFIFPEFLERCRFAGLGFSILGGQP